MADCYTRALMTFVAGDDRALADATRLGHELMTQGLSLRDVLALHRASARSVAAEEAGWRFLEEVLGSFERSAEMRSRILARAVESTSDGIIAANPEGTLVFVNRAAEELFGKDAADTPPHNWSNEFGLFELDGVTLFPADRLPLVRAMRGEQTEPVRLLVRNANHPSPICLSIVGSPLIRDDGGIDGGVVLFRDISASLRHEERLEQIQKMDVIGRLAGGVAHDFNNILSVMISYASLIAQGLEKDDPIATDAREICVAGRRAAELTRTLLMMSNHRAPETRVLDVSSVLAGMDKVLKRLLGADIDCQLLPAADSGMISADPSDIEHMVMNLAINARDAMPRGGKLTIEISPVLIDEAFASTHLGTAPGAYVMLTMSDTGVGTDRVTQTRIFEPFLRRLRGSIWVYSEVGAGTTFKIYIPRTDAETVERAPTPSPTTLRGTETVLLVEDDEQLRAVARQILHLQGYRVEECRNAGEALLRAEHEDAHFDLLLTDVVMPQMSGPELARRMTMQRPRLKVLCMSGYTDDSAVRHGVVAAGITYLQKPFTPDSFARRVREVLDAPTGSFEASGTERA